MIVYVQNIADPIIRDHNSTVGTDLIIWTGSQSSYDRWAILWVGGMSNTKCTIYSVLGPFISSMPTVCGEDKFMRVCVS